MPLDPGHPQSYHITMNAKKLLALILAFALGLGIGVAITNTAKPSLPPVLYKSEVFFSPEGNVRANIVKAIGEAKTSIDLAIFDLTSEDIKVALESAQKRGVKVRIIADNRQSKGPHSMVPGLVEAGLDIKITRGKGRGIMHNKFAIFDGKLMVTGSYNWTASAEKYNYENAVFITDPVVIAQYQKEFNEIWSSGPTLDGK